MKKDFSENVPLDVMRLHLHKLFKIPISISEFNRIVKENPTYFPTEFKRITNWEKIPESVHDAFWEELSEFKKKLWENEPKPVGIVGMMNNTPEYQEYKKAFDRLSPIEQKKENELRKKYYSSFGID